MSSLALSETAIDLLGLAQTRDSATLSQLVRSNTKHYWAWMKIEAPKNAAMTSWLQYRGVVLGDPHLGNFGVSLVIAHAGATEELRFVPIDFDDVGVGPFVLDLARYVVATEAITTEVKKQTLVDAYVNGLAHPLGEIPNPTTVVQQGLQLGISDYFSQLENKNQKLVNKKGDDFKWKTDDLIPYTGPLSYGDVESKIAGAQVLSLGHKIINRGGSKNAERIWVLVQYKQTGRKTILELKQWQTPGLSEYDSQPDFAQVLKDTYNYFWPGLQASTYSLILLNGTQYWLREKKLSLLDIPYTASSEADVQFIQHQAVYTAFALGQLHGRQTQGQQLLAKINGSPQGARELKEAIEPFVREYLDALKKQWAVR